MPYKALFLLVIPLLCAAFLTIYQSEIAAILFGLLSPSADYGMLYYTDLVELIVAEILWLSFFLLLTWAFIAFPSKTSLGKVFSAGARPNDHVILLVLVIFFMITFYVSNDTLEHFPATSNEYAYLFQAETFSRGKFWEPAHDLPGFFTHQDIAHHDGIQVSRFPPGWPLVLSLAFEAGVPPFIVNPILGVLTLAVFYFFARWTYGPQVAIWSLLAVAFTGFYVFNSASYLSHILCLLFTLLFVFSIHLYDKNRNILFGIVAGFFLGMIGIVRHYNALLVFAPFIIYFIVRYQLKSIGLLLAIALGALPLFLFLLSYNYSITGEAFLPVQIWAFPQDRLGFVNGHTFLQGIEHLVRWLALFMYWCSPGLLVLYFVFLSRKIKSPQERFICPEDYILVMLMAGHFFYYEFGGTQFGPRFLFEGFPFLVLFVVSKALHLHQKWAHALLLASLIYAMVKFPMLSDREERIVAARQDLYDLVSEQKIGNAVVFVSSSTSPLRPMDVTALTRNDPKFLNKVIYAQELPEISDQLMEYYSDRSFYKYTRDVDEVHGRLTRIK